MTNYARLYRFGITPWERYRTTAAASITALLDREETGRSRPLGRALDLAAAAASTLPSSRAGGGRPWASTTCRPRSRRRQRRAGAWTGSVCRRRRDAAAVGPPGDLRLLPRHRLLPGPGRRTASRPRGRCLGACQPRGHIAAAELRPEPVAAAGRRRIAGGGPDRLRGLGDARGRPGGYRRLGLADEQDRATLVQAAPTNLGRGCLVESDRDCRTAGIAWMSVPREAARDSRWLPGGQGCGSAAAVEQELGEGFRPVPPSGNVSGTAPG